MKMLSVLLSYLLSSLAAASLVNMRRITHPTVQQTLAGNAVLPCVFTLQTSSSVQPPHLLWTHSRPPARGQGPPLEQIVLSAKGKTKTFIFHCEAILTWDIYIFWLFNWPLIWSDLFGFCSHYFCFALFYCAALWSSLYNFKSTLWINWGQNYSDCQLQAEIIISSGFAVYHLTDTILTSECFNLPEWVNGRFKSPHL